MHCLLRLCSGSPPPFPFLPQPPTSSVQSTPVLIIFSSSSLRGSKRKKNAIPAVCLHLGRKRKKNVTGRRPNRRVAVLDGRTGIYMYSKAGIQRRPRFSSGGDFFLIHHSKYRFCAQWIHDRKGCHEPQCAASRRLHA